MFGHSTSAMVTSVDNLKSITVDLFTIMRSESWWSPCAGDCAYFQDGPQSIRSIGTRMDTEICDVIGHDVCVIIFSYILSQMTCVCFHFRTARKYFMPRECLYIFSPLYCSLFLFGHLLSQCSLYVAIVFFIGVNFANRCLCFNYYSIPTVHWLFVSADFEDEYFSTFFQCFSSAFSILYAKILSWLIGYICSVVIVVYYLLPCVIIWLPTVSKNEAEV